MAFPIPRHLQRVDREHYIAGGEQRLHPRHGRFRCPAAPGPARPPGPDAPRPAHARS
jgi:hypothetical protein